MDQLNCFENNWQWQGVNTALIQASSHFCQNTGKLMFLRSKRSYTQHLTAKKSNNKNLK